MQRQLKGKYMNTKILKAAFAGLILSVFCVVNIANAGLVKNGSIISDTDSGLDWMELTASTGITYNQMLANFNDVNSVFYGFEYASLTQIQALFNGEGYTGDFYSYVTDSGSIDATTQIYNLFGQTGVNCCDRGDGMYLNENGGLIEWLYYIPEYDSTTSLVRALNNFIDPDVLYWDGSNNNEIGSWIVRSSTESIPEPSTLAIFALAMIGLASRRLKK